MVCSTCKTEKSKLPDGTLKCLECGQLMPDVISNTQIEIRRTKYKVGWKQLINERSVKFIVTVDEEGTVTLA